MIHCLSETDFVMSASDMNALKGTWQNVAMNEKEWVNLQDTEPDSPLPFSACHRHKYCWS